VTRIGRVLAMRLAGCALIVAGLCAWIWAAMIAMPGKRWRGAPPQPTVEEARLAAELRRDVERLAGAIGERNLRRRPEALAAAADFVEEELREAGLAPRRQRWDPHRPLLCNVEAELRGAGRAHEIVVIGAHYDSVETPGADDNASGVAALLALARAFSRARPPRTIRFVAFANEEAPYFATEAMGSLAYARRCRSRGEQVVAMLSLESLGYYADTPGTQRYPAPVGLLYPSTGDFVAFVSDLGSRRLLRRTVGAFRHGARFPSEAGALFRALPGVGWSDHWAFWQAGYPALMVTDTAPYRNPHYHTAGDVPATLDYHRLSRVVTGLVAVVADLAEAQW
jgi:peptidase M28-like protein